MLFYPAPVASRPLGGVGGGGRDHLLLDGAEDRGARSVAHLDAHAVAEAHEGGLGRAPVPGSRSCTPRPGTTNPRNGRGWRRRPSPGWCRPRAPGCKTNIGSRTSEAGAKPDLARTWPDLGFLAEAVEKVRTIKFCATIVRVSRAYSDIDSTKPRISKHCFKTFERPDFFNSFSHVWTAPADGRTTSK